MNLKITRLSDGLGAEATGVDFSKRWMAKRKRALMRRSPKCRLGDQGAGFIGAAITGGRVLVWQSVPPTQYPVFLARMPADSLPQQSRPLREREALHS